MTRKPGSIIVFSNKGKAIFSIIQKLITHSWIEGISPKKFGPGDKTHSAMVWYPEANQDAIFEAYLCSTIDPFSNHTVDTKYWIFEPTGFTDQEIQEALYATYIQDSSSNYGFLELPWYAYRFIMELFHKDVRHQHNWFPGGNICSQDVYNYLYRLSSTKPMFREYLDHWRSTTFHSSDTFSVMTYQSTLFTLKETQQ